ncbi:hypothetical protein CTAYLR_003558 [Chrysophaeum taylorii]|uniref:Cytosolic Fe-S cluster assembly factor NUBP1 homolog n=1 Tax=Chrysophaeum taylorii TaxID=2483200 RepID=A0AAD7XP61_9STRA|nr:hypothetical protein CTAYLR_003558 [Chrysophaeum taylorii]
MSNIDASKANAGCVGPSSEEAGRAAACAGCPNAAACASGAGRTIDETPAIVRARLANVRHKIVVLSGKGGVGKSTVACQVAFALAAKGHAVGLLDVDICGPSVPRMLGLTGRGVHRSSTGWSPVFVDSKGELGVMSVGFLLPDNDNAVIWRAPRKNGLIKQFLTEVDWGDLDFLVIDTPPGTSDEQITIATYLKLADVSGAIVVTTPQEISMQDVRKELNFCAKSKLPVLGVVENMATVRTPLTDVRFIDKRTGNDDTPAIQERLAEFLQTHDVCVDAFVPPDKNAGPEAMAKAFRVPYLGALPLDPELTKACEAGVYFADATPNSPAAKPFQKALDAILAALPPRPVPGDDNDDDGEIEK